MAGKYSNIAGTGWSLTNAKPLLDPASEEHREVLQSNNRGRAQNPHTTLVFNREGNSFTDMKGNIEVAVAWPTKTRVFTPAEHYIVIDGLNEHELLHERITNGKVFAELIDQMQANEEKYGEKLFEIQDKLNANPVWEQLGQLQAQARQIALELAKLSYHGGDKTAIAQLEKAIMDIVAEQKNLHAQNPTLQPLADEMHKLILPILEDRIIKDTWNIVEDGRIETWSRHFEPNNYRQISFMNMLDPRIQNEWKATVEKPAEDAEAQAEGQIKAAPDPLLPMVLEKVGAYVPTDARGKKLPVSMGPDGTPHFAIFPGMTIKTWTKEPYDLKRQMRAALLAESVPEFTVGDLHPRVDACYRECLPVIAKGTTSEGHLVGDFARQIVEICKKHDLLDLPEEAPTGKGQGGGMQIRCKGRGVPVPGNGSQRGDGGGRGEGVSESYGNGAEGSDGGGMSQSDRDRDDKKGGSSRGDLEEEKKRADKEMEDQGGAAGGEEDGRLRGNVDGEKWNTPGNQHIDTFDKIVANGANIQIRGEHTQYAHRFAAELEDILTITRGPERHQKRGRIERKRLPSAMAGNEFVFFRPGDNVDIDISVEVVLDISGSMSHQRVELADAALTCHLALRKINVSHGIWGFSSDSREANHYEFKSVTRDDLRGLAGIGANGGRGWGGNYWGGGGTPTAQAVDFATARLYLRDENKKIMVVFTDGCPNDMESTKRAIRRAQDKGIIVIGVYFGEDSHGQMRTLFRDDFVAISDLSEMAPYLGRRIKRLVMSNGRAYEGLDG